MSDLVAAFGDYRRDDITARSWRNEQYILRRMVAHIGDKQIGRVSDIELEDFVRAWRSGGVSRLDGTPGETLSAGGANNVLFSVRQLIRWSARRGYCRGDLVDGIKTQKENPRRNFLRLSATELLEMVVSAKHPRDRAILAAACNTALRGKELADLKIGWLDMSAQSLFVMITKTGDTDYMPLSLEFYREMSAWLDYYRDVTGISELPGDWYLFPTKSRDVFDGCDENKIAIKRPGIIQPERRLSVPPSTIAQRALRAIGVESMEREGMHTIRRSVARLYFDACSNDRGYSSALRETMALLHHKSVATTERYLGLSVELASRDDRLRGKSFLGAMVTPTGNVTPLRRTGSL